jgi:hypothetical protein
MRIVHKARIDRLPPEPRSLSIDARGRGLVVSTPEIFTLAIECLSGSIAATERTLTPACSSLCPLTLPEQFTSAPGPHLGTRFLKIAYNLSSYPQISTLRFAP